MLNDSSCHIGITWIIFRGDTGDIYLEKKRGESRLWYTECKCINQIYHLWNLKLQAIAYPPPIFVSAFRCVILNETSANASWLSTVANIPRPHSRTALHLQCTMQYNRPGLPSGMGPPKPAGWGKVMRGCMNQGATSPEILAYGYVITPQWYLVFRPGGVIVTTRHDNQIPVFVHCLGQSERGLSAWEEIRGRLAFGELQKLIS